MIFSLIRNLDSDQTEHDYHYGEEKEDSDTESGGGGNSRGNSKRYSDRARAKTPENVVTTAPAFKLDEKKSISVKNTIKPAGTAAAAASAIKPTKKIDLGAATNYGKGADFGINSPTHRNTHNDEDLFVASPKVSSSKPSKAIIEDIFASSEAGGGDDDDFDPRAEEKETSQDFGDFESAFAGPAAKVPAPAPTEFADFAAFSAPAAAAPAPSSQSDIDNFLFSSPPPAAAAKPAAPSAQSTNFLDGADLFGNNVITSAFTSPPTSLTGNSKDLLSDFDSLSLNPVRGEKIY